MFTAEDLSDFIAVCRLQEVTQPQLEILFAIYCSRISMRQIQFRMFMSPQMTKYNVDRLLDLGLANTYDNPNDHRSRVVAITEEGKNIVTKVLNELNSRAATRAESTKFVPAM